MTAEVIYTGVQLILALVFDLVPGAKDWWERLPEEGKRWGWLLGSVGVPLALWALNCYAGIELFGFKYSCDQAGLIQMLILGWGGYWLAQGGHTVAKLSDRAY